MSHIKLAKGNKSNQSTSSFSSGPGVGDSSWTIKSMVTNVATGALFGLIVMLALPVILGSSDTHATASTLTVRIPSSSEVEGNSDTRMISIPPTAAGKFVNTDTVTYWISTTHAAGYTLTASANELADLTDSSKTIPTHSVTAGVSASNYADDTYASANHLNNTWGYLPSKYNSAVNALYLPAPIASAQTIDVTNTTANNAPYTIAVGARADHTLEQGQYQTQITLSAVGNPTPYSITYNANVGESGDTVDNMPTNHTALDDGATGDTINLASNYPYRNGYLFTGWCTNQVADNGACTGTGVIQYNPGATFELDQTSTIGEGDNSLVLYAMWDNCSGPNSSQLLYCKVRAQVKKDGSGNERTQTLADMQAVITEPTSNNPLTDTSNSGVYKYDAAYFGTASDAANSMPIYYFRGILDQTYASSDTYGGIPSSGDSAYYQNYVKLGDTCWRIVRTTGSGGTKMIYNGSYSGGTTSNSCANAGYQAATEYTYFNRATPDDSANKYGTNGFIAYVGYSYDGNYAYNHTELDSPVDRSLLYGNGSDSNIKTRLETWYSLNISSHAEILETSAGWCSDRSTTDTNLLTPYFSNMSGSHMFPAVTRNSSGGGLSLNCPDTNLDLFTVSNSNSGNGSLTFPIAPLTLDEVSLIGSGYGNGSKDPAIPADIAVSSNFSYSSYLRSGYSFWLISPGNRSDDSCSGSVDIDSLGYPRLACVHIQLGIRPSISLTSSTTISSGSGTATDPWVANAP